MAQQAKSTKRSYMVRGLDRWGELWLNVFGLIGGVYYLIQDVGTWLARAVFGRQVRFGRTALITQLVRVGARATGIVMLVCACVGLILALQMEPQLAEYGQSELIANIVGVSITRELGPLIAAIVLTGFAGAAIAAELGTMVVGEEIEALEAHALNPVRFLVVPRVLATTIGLILLTIIGDLTAIFAGGFMSVMFLGVPYELYKTNTLNAVVLQDFLTGLAKAGVFGLILSALACYHGLSVTGGAAGVGRATTATVVQAVVAVIIADLLFTTVFYSVGWA
ncbi:MAG: MlaE family ABC transporter permease [Planctomycetota bacterium]